MFDKGAPTNNTPNSLVKEREKVTFLHLIQIVFMLINCSYAQLRTYFDLFWSYRITQVYFRL